MDHFPYYTMEGGKKSIGPGVFYKKVTLARLWMAFSLDNFGRSFAAFASVTAGLSAGGTSRRNQAGFFFMPIEFPCHHSHIVAWAPYTAQPRICRKISVFVFSGLKTNSTSWTTHRKLFSKKISINLFKGMAPQRAGAEPSAQSTGLTVGGDRPGCRPQPGPVKPPPLREKWKSIWRNL